MQFGRPKTTRRACPRHEFPTITSGRVSPPSDVIGFADGETKPAKAWIPANRRPLILRGASVTKAGRAVGVVVCVKANGMTDTWCLATSHGDRTGAEIVKLYGKRFTVEESFRD